ncbi:MAG: SBBP repeat-containing protein [Gammaproteobacteria bacterium]
MKPSQNILSILSVFILVVLSTVWGIQLQNPSQVRSDLDNNNSSSRGSRTAALSVPSTSLRFEKNAGQVLDEVRFLVRDKAYTLFLTDNRAVYELSGTRDVIAMETTGSSANPVIKGLDKLKSRSNYFKGKNPANWQRDIPHFARVQYENIYPGIDLEYYDKDRHLEYDFIISPGADPADIKLSYSGLHSMRLDVDGNLIVETSAGEMKQSAPMTYQVVNGEKKMVESEYHLQGHQVSFVVAAYDTAEALVIDPGLTYSSYLGGNSADEANAIAVDATGNIYVTGWTQSANFPVLNELYLKRGDIDDHDIFITKFNADGSPAFSTYLGASGFLGDEGHGIAVHSNGNIYVTGYIHEAGILQYPTTPGAYSEAQFGNQDVFLSILDNNGSSLLYSSIIGGGLGDVARGIGVDSDGDAYITGFTFSDSDDTRPFPIRNAFQATSDLLNSTGDGFLLRISPDGNGDADLVYSTFLSGNLTDIAADVAIDNSGNAYVAGCTTSINFPTSGAAFQTVQNGPSDAFVTKINTNLSGSASLIYSTFLGGTSTEGNCSSSSLPNFGIAVDGGGNTYVAGQTSSADFPTTPGVVDNTLGGSSDAFITKLSPNGGSLIYSTFYGGSGDEEAADIAVDNAGDAYITGYTSSSDYPVANLSRVSVAYNGGQSDAFLTKIESSGSGSVDSYSMVYGGSDAPANDKGRGVAVDPTGNTVYFTGVTNSSTNFILTANAAQQVVGGGDSDAFVARIGPFADLSVVMNDNDAVKNGTLTYTVVVNNLGSDTATGVVLTVTLPDAASATYVSNDQGCSHVSAVVTCHLSNVSNGSSAAVSIDVIINVTSQVSATASVTHAEADYPLDNNTDTELTVANNADTGAPNDTQNNTNQNDNPAIPFIITSAPTTTGNPKSSGKGSFSSLTILGLFGVLVFRSIRRKCAV